MPLNLSIQELTEACTKLAGELDLKFWYRQSGNRQSFTFDTPLEEEAQTLTSLPTGTCVYTPALM